MRGFQNRQTVAAVARLLAERTSVLGTEKIDLKSASGRVLAESVTAEFAVPGFRRSAMDGYALRGEETFSAGEYNASEFEVVGEVLPGRPFTGEVQKGEAVRIMTGSPVPAGADSVLQAEAAEEILRPGTNPLLKVTAPIAPGKNVGQVGEDIAEGTIVLSRGRVLRPQDVGVLASIGASPVSVVCQPRVRILVTGNELLPCGSKPQGYQIVDSNSVMLAALARRDGAIVSEAQMVGDDPEAIKNAITKSNEDVLLVSGGSSVGVEDHAPRLVAQLGELPVHGVALRPASPTGVGFVADRVIFLLPGNPVSCLCAYDLFAGPTLRRLGGRDPEMPYRRIQLPLTRKIVSAIGRTDYARVRMTEGGLEPLGISGASILSSTTRADGFVIVPMESEGYPPGAEVEVHLYDQA
ncbi:MAG: gephyrin-like molybdotransferase Glp [Gemmataceae bacterium]